MQGIPLTRNNEMYVVADTTGSVTISLALALSVSHHNSQAAIFIGRGNVTVKSPCEGMRLYPDQSDLGVVITDIAADSVVHMPIDVLLDKDENDCEFDVEARFSTGAQVTSRIRLVRRTYEQFLHDAPETGNQRWLCQPLHEHHPERIPVTTSSGMPVANWKKITSQSQYAGCEKTDRCWRSRPMVARPDARRASETQTPQLRNLTVDEISHL